MKLVHLIKMFKTLERLKVTNKEFDFDDVLADRFINGPTIFGAIK